MIALLSLLIIAHAEEATPPTYPLLQVTLEEVKIKERQPIPLPPEAAEIELPNVTCSMRVFIDPKGITESVTVAGCPGEFHRAVQESVMQWRFKPIKTPERQPARATFVMAVTLDLTAHQRAESEEELAEEPE
jgi:hypothetical protein